MNVRRHELIGLRIKVIAAKNPALVGMEGKIIDETQNTLTIMYKDVQKKLIKNQIKMKVKLHKKMIELDGKDIVGRPEERIKK